jgi:hypothetical protein
MYSRARVWFGDPAKRVSVAIASTWRIARSAENDVGSAELGSGAGTRCCDHVISPATTTKTKAARAATYGRPASRRTPTRVRGPAKRARALAIP